MLTLSAEGAKRVFARLDDLYAIGGGEGANRPGFSPEEQAAHDLATAWMREAGLAIEVDACGNLIGRLPGTRPELAEVWTGSHLDSVPGGGRFDGALGVVAFRAEETGCHGSRARCVESGLPGVFVEVHVEQGPVLADAGVPLGLVTSIAGIVRGERVFTGRAGHAGTTPMAGRDDALVAAAEYVLRVSELARGIEGAVGTVGRLDVVPGAENVIPERVRLTVDARAPDAERLDALVEVLELEPHYRAEPVRLAERPRAALGAEVEALGLAVVELSSGAGHDAGILAAAGVESAMLFVRSLAGGVSHSPEEHSSDEDVGLAVEVLTGALVRLASDRA